MQRWVLKRGGKVRGYVLTEVAPDDSAKRKLCFGDADARDDAGELLNIAGEGTWRLVPESAGLVGDDWTWDGEAYELPVQA